MPCDVDHSAIKVGGFCTRCGIRIEEIQSPVLQSLPSVINCPNGHSVSSKKKFCETCGVPMAGFGSTPTNGSYSNPSVAATYAPPISNNGVGFAAQPHSSGFSATPYDSTPTKKSNTGLFAGLGIAASLIFILIIFTVSNGSSGGSSDGDSGGVYTPSTTTISVTMAINGEYCSDLSWGYGDIPGGSIILSVDGIPKAYASYSSYGTDSSTSCDFNAYFYNVPTSGTIYSVRMASGLRGTVDSYGYELAANGWQFNLSLG